MNMFNVLENNLKDGMKITQHKEFANRFDFTLQYKDMKAKASLMKMCTPGSEVKVCRQAIDTAVSTMYINEGNLEEAQKWLDGKCWEEDLDFNTEMYSKNLLKNIIIIENRKKEKEKTLEHLQDVYRYKTKEEIKFKNYECNSITSLIEMSKLKAEIEELDFVLKILEKR